MPNDNNFIDHALNADENVKAIYSQSGKKVPTEEESLENYKQFTDEIEQKMWVGNRQIDEEIEKFSEENKGQKPFIGKMRRKGFLGSSYLHNRHLENIQIRKQKSDQAEFEQKLADAHKVVTTMNSTATTAPGAKITAAVHFLNPYMAPFIEELQADNLRRIKSGKH